ncbi:MAG: aspartate kinase, partial [Thermodesulfobacteriota bacterium]
MKVVVQKFGGSSVANLERMRQVQEKVERKLNKGYKVIAVLSAMSGETDRLLDLAEDFSSRPDTDELDSLLCTGEQTSTALFSMLMRDRNIKTRSVLGFQIPVRTDNFFGKARIRDISSENLLNMLKEYDVLAVAGFQGCDENQRLTTLGRGGSDTSAVALAAALKAQLCEIYSDVDGVFTTDPNVCMQAQKMSRIAYDEMLEMASMGAKVLQIRSVEFAKKYNVPVHVRSTFNDVPGTLLVQEDKDMEGALVSGIAYDKNQARITLVNVFDQPGIASRVFNPLAEAGIVVDMIVQNFSKENKTDITFTVPREELEQTLEIIEKTKEDIGAVDILSDTNVAKVSVIGVGMRNHSGV